MTIGGSLQITSLTKTGFTRLTKFIVMLALFFVLMSCGNPTHIDTAFLSHEDIKNHTLSTASIKLNASSLALNIKKGLVITDNDQAFAEKIRLIKQAKNQIDLAYYIYKDDYSSSVFSQALIEAANRGVAVRLLLDYQSTYADLDLFSMLERYGNKGKGSLEVRFYNRPTLNIIKDAVYLTLGCSARLEDKAKDKKKTSETSKNNNLKACNSTKYKEIEAQFSKPNNNDLNVLNYNSGGSGLFLSAFYANNIKLMALAINEGQNLTIPSAKNQTKNPKSKLDADTLNKLVSLSKTYIQARHGKGFQRFAAKLKLKLAFAFFGGEINPYYDAFTAYFPIGKDKPRVDSLKDWNYVKDFYHQKLLLVDSNQLILGGRNVEDAYHMHPNPLTEHYVFLDTDVLVELHHQESSIENAFERLWNYRQMVATTRDIRLHAPNDFLVATVKSQESCKQPNPQQQSACEKSVFDKELNLEYRIQKSHNTMIKHASQFRKSYIARSEAINPSFVIDDKAEVYYVENLPFKKDQPSARQYGATNGKEGSSGKYIHNLWLAALRNTCQKATADDPQNVIMHNAYVFLPSNLLRQLSDMLTGKLDCRHVTITILTNSLDTTDLGIENYAARYSMKASHQYVEENRDKQRAATLAYYEYQTNKESNTIRSLHSKVMIFGTDLFIGSANADVRSYMMDANNGLYIQHAPELLKRYTTWFNALLADSKRTKNISQRFAQISLQEMLSNDVSKLEDIVSSFASNNPDQALANPAIQSQLKLLLKSSLEKIHNLSLKCLGKKQDNYEAGEQLNALFKII